ncbi:MAG: hypothetical protein ACJ76P_04115 [Actinomycetota bacterium]
MSQEGTAGGFEQASADAARLAGELAEIRKQLTELREQNAKFLASDPVAGSEPSEPVAKDQSKQPVAKTIGANAKAAPPTVAAAGKDVPAKAPAKEPQMAAASRTGGAPAVGEGSAEPSKPTAEEPDTEKKRWWKKQKPDAKDTGF